MSKKKKRNIIIAIILLLCIAVTTTIVLVTRNPRRKQENQIADNGDIQTEEQTDDISISHDTSGNVTLSSNSTEGKTESAEENITEDAEKPTTESGSTEDGNKPTGGTSGSTTSQPTMTQTSTTQPTTQAPTIQTPNTTEQPSGGNQGGGNGGNTHQHTWEAQYRTVHHEEEGHWEEVYKEAYDEPVYETHNFCGYCKLDITASGQTVSAHCTTCGPPLSEDDIRYVPGLITTAGSNYGTKDVQVNTIHHEAVYEKKWIVDKKAYDEQVPNGYKCTTCGATK